MTKAVTTLPKTAQQVMALRSPTGAAREVLFTTGKRVYRLHLHWTNGLEEMPQETVEALGPKEAATAKERLTYLQNVSRESNIDIHERAADDIGPLIGSAPDGQMALV
jgi:hypothetical protein